jgi:uncharacterized protein
MKKSNIVGWFEIYVEDMERAKKFYQSVFQRGEFMDLSNEQLQMFAFPWIDEADGAAGALVKADFSKPSENGTIVYFNCEDCQTEELRANENGGVVIMPKTSIGEFGFVSMVKDTEGNVIGLHSKK